MPTRQKFNLLPVEDLFEKVGRIREIMSQNDVDAILIADNGNKYYLTGRIFSGFILLTREDVQWFVKRPSIFEDENITLIRKVENIAEHVDTTKLGRMAFELSQMSYADVTRYAKAFGVQDFANADPILMGSRAVKTAYELSRIEQSGIMLSRVYAKVPGMYEPGMSDMELQFKIETLSRKEGCLGIFRINGQEMEFFMGNVLVGDNADNPSPYDFAMGGAGADPSLPVGANGTIIKRGNAVMVDTNGNFTGYMTDMTRTFACGQLSAEACKAHQLSIEICRRLSEMGKPGVKASDLYAEAVRMASDAGLEDRFMGHRSKAGFVGHGVGISINEWPVIAPRSKDVLHEGNVIALEPKFVIDGAGAVGVENTYVVEDGGMRRLTHAPEELTAFIDS